MTASISRREALRGLAGALGVAVLGPRASVEALLGPPASDVSVRVRSAYEGLVAWMLPGNDRWSRAQGDAARGPGGIAAGAVDVVLDSIDRYVPVHDVLVITGDATYPLSSAVALAVDAGALAVRPTAAVGPFPSPFANLTAVEKTQVFERLAEVDDADVVGLVQYVVALLPALLALACCSEGGALRRDRTLARRPVAWTISGYQPDGPLDGWDALLGYYDPERRRAR